MDLRDITEFFRDTFKYIIVIIVVLIVVIYIASLQQVVGPSMQPTLNDGDVLLLGKSHYKLFSVKRNDVIAFNYADTKYLIKRVIGLPGEKVEYQNNILYIDDIAYKETIVENLVTEDFSLQELGYETIPDNMYLVLGDNRGDSMDSRSFGLISKKDIIGKVLIRIWPLNGIKILN